VTDQARVGDDHPAGSPPGPPLAVSGGAGGIEAHYEDLHTLAALSDGLTALAVDYAGHAVGLRATVALYQATDAAQKQAFDTIAWTLGNHPLLAAAIAVQTAPAWLPLAGLQFAQDGGDPQRFLSDHLGVVDTATAALPGLITRLSGGILAPYDVTSGGHLLGQLYPEGRATVTAEPDLVRPDTQQPESRDPTNPLHRPPASLGALLDGLDYRNRSVTADTPDRIDVRVVTHPDGTKAYIVDIPGTKVWDTPGQDPGAHLNTLGTNIHLTGGDLTARETAIADALHQAGATTTDPVMLVGHSQGGIIAAQAAHDAATGTFGHDGHGYNVTHVVTAGSPVGRIDVPADVQVLALENRHDIVPHLDAAPNPDRPNQTTVTFDLQNGSLGDNHDTNKSYALAGHSLDTSTHPSVRAFTDSAAPFLAPDSRTTTSHTVYDLTRKQR